MYLLLPLKPTDLAKTVALIDNGRSIGYAVRRTIGFPYSNVQRVIVRYQETHAFTRRPESARDDRFLVSTISRNRKLSDVFARNRLLEVRNID